jgi:hypothetical protein
MAEKALTAVIQDAVHRLCGEIDGETNSFL